MSNLTDREKALLESLWEAIPQQAAVVLGVDVELAKMKVSEGIEDLGKKQYFATLTTDRPTKADIFLGFDDRTAIAFAGLLVMMQEKVIVEKMGRREMDEDDLDAMSECVNQMGSAINKALHEHLGNEYHVVLTGGGLREPPALETYKGTRIIVARGKITVGTLHTGEFRILLPEVLTTGKKGEETATPGLTLCREEGDALRRATLEGLSGGETVYLYLPLARDIAQWESLFSELGVESVITDDLHELRHACRSGEVQLVVVDADACQQGGLPALAKLVSWADIHVPVIVAASRPTRSHLVSCLASGAVTYVVKPLDADRMRQVVSDVTAAFAQRVEERQADELAEP